MFNLILNIFNKISILLDGNVALTSIVSLWGLSGVSLFLWKVPKKIFSKVWGQCYTSLSVDNASSYEQQYLFFSLMSYFNDHKNTTKFSRHYKAYMNSVKEANNVWKNKTTLSFGYGKHIFCFNKKYILASLNRLPSEGSSIEKMEIILYTLGRSNKVFVSFLQSFESNINENDIAYKVFHNSEWVDRAFIKKRDIDTVAINENIKNNIIKEIDFFISSEDWYVTHGLSYKTTFLLHGKPGTGKTSLIKGIASKYNRAICNININQISDASLEDALSKIDQNSILLIEDVDSASSIHKRTSSKMQEAGVITDDNNVSGFTFLSLTGVLNALDGIKSMHNIIIFLTTNDIHSLDPAFLRKGRMDYIYEINEITKKEIDSYAKKMYSNYKFNFTCNEILGCELNAGMLYAKDSPKLFEEYINKIKNKK